MAQCRICKRIEKEMKGGICQNCDRLRSITGEDTPVGVVDEYDDDKDASGGFTSPPIFNKNSKPKDIQNQRARRAGVWEGSGSGGSLHGAGRTAVGLGDKASTAVSSAVNTGKYVADLGSGITTASTLAAPVAFPVGIAAQTVISGLAQHSVTSTRKKILTLEDIADSARYDPRLCKCDYLGEVIKMTANPLVVTDAKLREGMEKIHGQGGGKIHEGDHEMIRDHVLPYLIRKKGRKLESKKIERLPVVAAAEAGRRIWRAGKKTVKGNRGVDRGNAAAWIAFHWMYFDCGLCYEIVRVLCGSDVDNMQLWKYEDVRNLIMQKLSIDG